jgi:hypothetical protein
MTEERMALVELLQKRGDGDFLRSAAEAVRCPSSRMVAPYAGNKPIPAERAGTAIFIPVTNLLERLNKEVKRRADVVGIFPNDATITRLHRRSAAQAERRVAAPMPLHTDRRNGWTHNAADQRRSGKTFTHGGPTNGHLKLHPDLHHPDGRGPRRSPQAL